MWHAVKELQGKLYMKYRKNIPDKKIEGFPQQYSEILLDTILKTELSCYTWCDKQGKSSQSYVGLCEFINQISSQKKGAWFDEKLEH